MHNQLKAPICSIIIPAYNEATVIGATLKALTKDIRNNEFEIFVVCNGCNDGTAEVARKAASGVKVFELSDASKTNAMNVGMAAAVCERVVFLDADIITSSVAVRNLIHRLDWAGVHMAYGHAHFEAGESSWAVNAFYRAWGQNPYFDGHKMGGFFAISKSGLEELGTLPNTVNDDEFIRRKLQRNSVYSEAAPYFVKAPRNLWSLVKVRSRVYRGNRELEGTLLRFGTTRRSENARKFVKRLLRRPKLWPGAGVFAGTTILAHLRNFLCGRSARTWDRDNSNREQQVG